MKKSVLLVDDEPKVTELLGRYLEKQGFAASTAANGTEALQKAGDVNPDVVLLDIMMPGMSGMEALEKLKADHPDMEVIMATAVNELDTAVEAMQKGAFGYQVKPFNLEAVLMDIHKALEHKRLVEENRNYQQNLEQMVEEKTAEVKKLHANLKDSFKISIRILVNLVEQYDQFLGGHSKRVAFWAMQIGDQLGLSPRILYDLEIAGMLHDIGTIAIPDELKKKPFSELTEEDTDLIKKHPIFAQGILQPAAAFENAALYIRHHLERIDGGGFPDGLEGEKIPLGARILAVANAFDEVRTRRRFTGEKFKHGIASKEFAMAHLKNNSKRRFDPKVILAMERAIEKIKREKANQVDVRMDELKPGMVLASSIFRKDGKLVLSKGHELNSILVMKLKGMSNMRLLQPRVFVYKDTTEAAKGV